MAEVPGCSVDRAAYGVDDTQRAFEGRMACTQSTVRYQGIEVGVKLYYAAELDGLRER